MFIEDIVELVNSFAKFGIRDFRVECRDGCLWIYTKDKLIIKDRRGGFVGPMMDIGNEFVTEVNLEGTQFLADGQVYNTSYSYNPEKENVRKVVREEIEKYLKEKYHGRIILK